MKLATALSERSDVQNRLEDVRIRLVNNSKKQEGDDPAENPADLMAELDRLCEKYNYLVSHINQTNSATVVDGVTVTELLAQRDTMKKRYDIMKDFLNEASKKVDRYARAEIKVESTVDVKAYQKETDELSMSLRKLDEKIQEANWTTELI